MWSFAVESATGLILLAIEAVPQSQAVVAAAAKLARQSHADVVVLSVRERDYVRGYGWDVRQPGEIAETVSRAIYELERAGADEIVIGTSRRSWLGGLLMGSVAPQVLRHSDLPVVAVPTNGLPRRKNSALPISA
jgi:nucleotide-binding universal stress UspA family protein